MGQGSSPCLDDDLDDKPLIFREQKEHQTAFPNTDASALRMMKKM